MKLPPNAPFRIHDDVEGKCLTLPAPEEDPDEERIVELEHVPCDWADEVLIAELPDRGFVVGYLVHDDSPSSPMEGDGVGEILRNTEGRRYHDNVTVEIREALGLDENGEPDLGGTDSWSNPGDDSYLDRAARRLHGYRKSLADLDGDGEKKVVALATEMWTADLRAGKIGNPHAIVLDANHDETDWGCDAHLGNWIVPERIRVDGVWIPDDSTLQNVRDVAPTRLLPPGVKVEYLSGKGFSNRITITYPNGEKRGGYESFAQAAHAAARKLGIRFTKAELLRAEREEAFAQATGICREYSFYASGEAFGVIIERFDARGRKLDDREDECWGYFGQEYARSELMDTMTANVEYARRHPHYCPGVPEYRDPDQLELLAA